MVCQAIYKKKKNHPIETFQKITGASFYFFLIEIKKSFKFVLYFGDKIWSVVTMQIILF
jgi:hypothetical protein